MFSEYLLFILKQKTNQLRKVNFDSSIISDVGLERERPSTSLSTPKSGCFPPFSSLSFYINARLGPWHSFTHHFIHSSFYWYRLLGREEHLDRCSSWLFLLIICRAISPIFHVLTLAPRCRPPLPQRYLDQVSCRVTWPSQTLRRWTVASMDSWGQYVCGKRVLYKIACSFVK